MSILKTDILKSAKQSEDQAEAFVEQTKQLLLEEGTRETALLAAAGLNKASVIAEKAKGEQAIRSEMKSKAGAEAVLTEAQIKALCMKYYLRFLPSRAYAGKVDSLIGRRMAKFLDDLGDPSPEHSARNRFFVLAPANAFTLSEVDYVRPIPDPVLFYRHDSGMYAVVHKWGDDFNVLRRVLGFCTATLFRWQLSTLAAFVVCSCVPFLTLDGWPKWVFGIFFSLLTAVRFVSMVGERDDEREFRFHERRTFSEHAWNNEERSKKSLWWF